MGQYYLALVEKQGKIKVYNNKVDGEWGGLKLMEHSYWYNKYVGNVVRDLFYKPGRVCWVGDYYEEGDYYQVNANNPELVQARGDRVWKSRSNGSKTSKKTAMLLDDCIIINHTKKIYLDCDKYYKQNMWFEEWNGKEYPECIHPLPLLTCTASHSGGSYHGINKDECGTWFNDEIEIRWSYDKEDIQDYEEVEFEFKEN